MTTMCNVGFYFNYDYYLVRNCHFYVINFDVCSCAFFR